MCYISYCMLLFYFLMPALSCSKGRRVNSSNITLKKNKLSSLPKPALRSGETGNQWNAVCVVSGMGIKQKQSLRHLLWDFRSLAREMCSTLLLFKELQPFGNVHD